MDVFEIVLNCSRYTISTHTAHLHLNTLFRAENVSHTGFTKTGGSQFDVVSTLEDILNFTSNDIWRHYGLRVRILRFAEEQFESAG